jgi:hypothetical protein
MEMIKLFNSKDTRLVTSPSWAHVPHLSVNDFIIRVSQAPAHWAQRKELQSLASRIWTRIAAFGAALRPTVCGFVVGCC